MTAHGWAIETVGLTKRFGPVLALDGLDLTVPPGETFGFLGPNGAGKSTTIRLLLNLIRPTAGSAHVHGVPATDVRRAHRHIGYLPGDVALWPQLTGIETLELFANLAGGVDPGYRSELLERLQLDPSRRVGTYSRGTRQKLALVVAQLRVHWPAPHWYSSASTVRPDSSIRFVCHSHTIEAIVVPSAPYIVV